MDPAALTLDGDILNSNKNAMVGLGFVLEDLGVTSTIVCATPCVPTGSPSMSVLVGPGRIYAPQNIDNTTYGSLAADTTHQISKQGILLDAVSIGPAVAPATVGQSVVYLIEGQYQDNDGGQMVVPYFNSANPLVPWSGPLNSGLAQPTVRQGLFVIQSKIGTPATTGTQVAPTADAGWTPLYAITIAHGQTTITAPNIAVASGAPFFTGFTTPPQLAAGVATAEAYALSVGVAAVGLTANGSVQFSNGLVFMWGSAIFASGGSTINFPTIPGAGSAGFPTGCLQVLMTLIDAPPGSAPSWGVSSITQTSFVGVGNGFSCSWFAIGH